MRRATLLVGAMLYLVATVSALWAYPERVVEVWRSEGGWCSLSTEARETAANPADGSVWQIGGATVYHLSPTGETLARSPALHSPHWLAVDANNGSCWVAQAFAGVDWDPLTVEVTHLSSEGRVLSTTPGLPKIHSLHPSPSDGSVWVKGQFYVGERDPYHPYVIHLSATGQLLARFDEYYSVVVDPNDGATWLLSATEVMRLNADGTEMWRVPGSLGRAAEDGRDHSLWLVDTSDHITHLSATGQVLWQGGTYEGYLSNVWVSPANGEVWVYFNEPQGVEMPFPLLVRRDPSGAELSRITGGWLAGNEGDGSIWMRYYEDGGWGSVAQLDAGGTELRRFSYDYTYGSPLYSEHDNSFWSVRVSGEEDYRLFHRGPDGGVLQEIVWPQTVLLASTASPVDGSMWTWQGGGWTCFSPEGLELARRAESGPRPDGLAVSLYDLSWWVWEWDWSSSVPLLRHLAPDGAELSTYPNFTYAPVVNPTDGSVWGTWNPTNGSAPVLGRITSDGVLRWTRAYATTSRLMDPVLEPDGSAWIIVRDAAGDTREHISPAGDYLGDLPLPAAMREAYVDWLPWPVQAINAFAQAPDGTIYALFTDWSEDGQYYVIGGGVRRLTHDGVVLWERTGLTDPYQLVINPADTSVWVSDGGITDSSGYSTGSSVTHYAADGTLLWQGTTFNSAYRISLDPRDGSAWSEDWGNKQIVHLAVIPAPFPDIPGDCWAFDAIKACATAGLVGGYPDGAYHPELPVTRDQMAVFISRALAGGDAGVPAGPETATFSDVPTSYWAFKYVEYAKSQGVVGGYPEGTYQPTVPVTRDQMAVFVARAIAGGDASVPTGPATATFPDVPTGFWAFKYVEYIKTQGVTGGYPDGTYRPALGVTRDQMAVYVARAFGL